MNKRSVKKARPAKASKRLERMGTLENKRLLRRSPLIQSRANRTVSAAVERVLKTLSPSDIELRVGEYMTSSLGHVSIAMFLVDSTPALLSFEQKIVEAVQPFAVRGGTAEAFALAAGESAIEAQTISWVENFVPSSSGKNYIPHITLGVGDHEAVEALKRESLKAFTFKPQAVAIYQLGNFGTAQRKLWVQSLQQGPPGGRH